MSGTAPYRSSDRSYRIRGEAGLPSELIVSAVGLLGFVVGEVLRRDHAATRHRVLVAVVALLILLLHGVPYLSMAGRC